MVTTLSKSRYLNGLQCPKLLWIASNQPQRIPEPDAATQHVFEEGHRVGELGKKLFPEGIDVPTDDFRANIAKTKELIKQRKPMFEPGVLVDGLYSRADVLNPVNDDEWDIIEVKSSTSKKPFNVDDVSFQRLCWESSGLKIRKCFLAYINNQYVRNGEVSPKELFIIEDISGEVAAAGESIRERTAQMLEVISLPECPEATIGPQCNDPYACPVATECWEHLPENNVFTLYRGGSVSQELYRNGVLDIADIPADYKLDEKQRIQCRCVANGKAYVDKQAISRFLASLEYPVHYLDFETFSTAIPLFDGTRPYQNIPFQFSLHVQDAPYSEAKQFSFLAEGGQDPRPKLIERLSQTIGDSGSIVVYNESFEKRVLRELGGAFPEYAQRSESVIGRVVDLIIPFRSFHYYHPDQKGSASLKKVMAVVTGCGYENMAIAQGEDASLAFLKIMYGEMSDEERQQVRDQLLAYCDLDTKGMVDIVDALINLCQQHSGALDT